MINFLSFRYQLTRLLLCGTEQVSSTLVVMPHADELAQDFEAFNAVVNIATDYIDEKDAEIGRTVPLHSCWMRNFCLLI